MNLRPTFNRIKSLFGLKQEPSRVEEVTTHHKVRPPVKRPHVPATSKRKHKLHAHHFGTFSPLRPFTVRGRRRIAT